MEIAYVYTKVRSEFGKDVNPVFVDEGAQMLSNSEGFNGSIPADEAEEEPMVQRNPCSFTYDTALPMSETEMNTEKVIIKSTAMKFTEGGWPKEIDPEEKQDTKRFVTKAQKQEEYKDSVVMMAPIIERCMKQNGTTDIYEEYFEGKDAAGDHSSTPPSMKAIAVMKDPNNLKRSAQKIMWQPGSTTRMGVAYSIMSFQDKRFSMDRLSLLSYIWDVARPNNPERELKPPSAMTCLDFNPKQHDMMAAGCYNGLVTVFDLKQKRAASIGQSDIPTTHHDPVYDVKWINSKTGREFVSTATDGRMLYWDIANMTAPLNAPTEWGNRPKDEVLLAVNPGDPGSELLGGHCLEYNPEAGATKFLVGTEQGSVVGFNSKQKRMNGGLTIYDMGVLSKHHGPVSAIQRNPIHTKFFLTVGDWCAKIWVEDGKTPVLSTSYHDAYLTGGCWSASRPGVFYLTRVDGVVHVWDYNARQETDVLTYKVGDLPLTSINVCHDESRFVAVGDNEGTVTLLQTSASLSELVHGEKTNIGLMLDREALQEKNLMLRERDLARDRAKKKAEKAARGNEQDTTGRDEAMEELLREVDADFMLTIKNTEAKEQK